MPTFFPLSLVTYSLPASFRTIGITSFFCFLIDEIFFGIHFQGRKWIPKGKRDAQETIDDNGLKCQYPDSKHEHTKKRGF